MSSSKPEWLNTIRKILIDNLDQIEMLVTYLGTKEFNATAKWCQLTDPKLETRLFKFMDLWYEQTNHPSLNQIISVVKDMKKKDIVSKIQNNASLKEQLGKEDRKSEDHVPCDINCEDEQENVSIDAMPEASTASGITPVSSTEIEIAELNIGDEHPFEQYLISMDFEMKFDYQDAMILFHDDDEKEVQTFLNSIENNMVLCDKQKPKIVLFPRLASACGGKFQALSFGLERCTFVMLYVTAKFKKDAWSIYSSEVCLINVIENTKWRIVAVYINDKSSTSNMIELAFNPLQEFYYSPGVEDFDVLKKITDLFNDRISIKTNNQKKHFKIQKKWVQEFEAREQGLEMSENERRSEIQSSSTDENDKPTELSVAKNNDQLTQDEGRNTCTGTSNDQDIDTDNPSSLSTADLVMEIGNSKSDDEKVDELRASGICYDSISCQGGSKRSGSLNAETTEETIGQEKLNKAVSKMDITDQDQQGLTKATHKIQN